MRPAVNIELNKTQTEQLENMARSLTLAARFVLRANMILLTAEGYSQRIIGQHLGCNHKTIGAWQRRWISAGIQGLLTERPGRGRKAWVLRLVGQEVIRKTLEETPEHASEWTARGMAKAMGVAAATVRKIWEMHSLDPNILAAYTCCPAAQLDEVLTPDAAHIRDEISGPDDPLTSTQEAEMPPAEGAATEPFDGSRPIDPIVSA